jgi:proteasome lid subunit RPN8/RPN11
VVIPAAIRAELEQHARAEEPNEACGLVAVRDGVAERYIAAANAAASPYRFELETDPENWFLEDEGYEVAAASLADGRREHRPLGGPALPDPVALDR